MELQHYRKRRYTSGISDFPRGIVLQLIFRELDVTENSKNNVLKVKTLVDHNRRITVRELASRLDLSVGNVHRILHNQLEMRRVAARWIPRLLDKDQKQARIKAAQGFLQRFHREGQQFLAEL